MTALVFSKTRMAALMMLVVMCMLLSSSSVGAFSAVRPTTRIDTRSLVPVTPSSPHETAWARSSYKATDHEIFRQTTSLASSTREEESDDPLFDSRTTISLVGGQSLLIVAAIIVAFFLKTPNYGLGPNIIFSQAALVQGIQCAIPLFVLAYGLDTIEERVPALQDVTKATLRSVLALLGGTLKPALALVVSLALGLVAGFGEEMLFRGVMQYELSMKFGTLLGVAVSSIVFGLLHAVTPLYAFFATLASVFFGSLYVRSGNLAVPIVTHAVYDIGALLWAHWTVAQMTPQEREDIANWKGPLSTGEEEGEK